MLILQPELQQTLYRFMKVNSRLSLIQNQWMDPISLSKNNSINTVGASPLNRIKSECT